MGLLLLAGSCATHRPKPPQPTTHYILPFTYDPDAFLCVELPPKFACIRISDLRKLMASLGNS
jgi:hypothetical protein